MKPPCSKQEEGITEKFSENQPTRKRGRPRRFNEAGYNAAKWLSPHVHTERGQLNQRYITFALNLLLADHPDRERYGWLCPDRAITSRSHGSAAPGL